MRPSLVDTDTLSEVIKGRDLEVARRAAEYLATHSRFTFSIITRYEILRGLKTKGAARQIEHFEERCRMSTVLPLSDKVVNVATDIYRDLHHRGELISDADILIAATAIAHGMHVVTENPDHFSRIKGLLIDSWRK